MRNIRKTEISSLIGEYWKNKYLRLKASIYVPVKYRAENRRKSGYYSISEAAEYLGISQGSLREKINRNRFPRPTHTIKGIHRKFYKKSELETFNPVRGRVIDSKEFRSKYMTRMQAQAHIGVSQPTWDWHRKKGRIPAPTHKVKGHGYAVYTVAEVEKINRFFRKIENPLYPRGDDSYKHKADAKRKRYW